MKIEGQIAELVAEQSTKIEEEPMNIHAIVAKVKYFLEHLII